MISLKKQHTVEKKAFSATPPGPVEILEHAINSSLENILKMGAYIILCDILCQFVLYFCNWQWLRCILCGLLEITTGIDVIVHSTLSPSVQIIMVCSFCAFGGLSCIGQTQTAAREVFNAKKYICAKLFLGLFTLLWTSFITYVFL